MIILDGIPASEGIAFGNLYLKKTYKPDFNINFNNNYKIKNSQNSQNSKEEINRYLKSREQAVNYTRELYNNILIKYNNSQEAEIFKAHELMLLDKDFNDNIIKLIQNNNMTSELAVWETAQKYYNLFNNMQNEYLKSKAQDILDISTRILNFLQNKTDTQDILNKNNVNSNLILFGDDFTPSDISHAEKNNITGFVSNLGSYYAHSSILLRTMKIPLVITNNNINFNQICEKHINKYVIIDGYTGKIYIDPDENIITELKNKKQEYNKINTNLEYVKNKECISLDGKKIKLCANMNTPEELDNIISINPDGIGLIRSEFIYLDKNNYPSEEEQFNIYKNILLKFNKNNNKKVVIRTLDIGSDKTASYMNFPSEVNPAMGCRGIRFCLKNTKIFKTQLKALYRASIYGNLHIMFPMITSVSEIHEIKKYIKEIFKELEKDNIKFNKNLKLGAMIETPSAAIISDDLAKEVDFFSIGTNDLTQYTLAVDRQNNSVFNIYDSGHKSVMRLINLIIQNAHKNNITVSICGDVASNENLVPELISMGIDELSVISSHIYKTKKVIISTDTTKISKKY